MGGFRSSTISEPEDSRKRVKLPLLESYSLLQAKYGWTVDYIKGKWVKICTHSQEPCNWGSCYERKTCKSYDLELYGLTRPLFLKFIEIASGDNYDREKRLYNILGLLIVGKEVIKDDNSTAQASNSNYTNSINIEAKKKDILYDFPYDVQYPSGRQISDNIKYWKDYSGEETGAKWDMERANAARGNLGIIARRCAVNDLLWREFKENMYTDQGTLKSRIKLDHIRKALYPPAFPLAKICIEPPPIEYWIELNKTDKLSIYLYNLKDAGFDKIGDVIPITDAHLEFLQTLEGK